MENPDDNTGLLPVVKFLQSALAMKAKGDALHYQHLVAQLLMRDDPETLWRLYLGLAQCVTTISQQPEEFKELIDALFRFDWCANDKVVSAFSRLLTHLVSANGTCMVPAMHMLVRNLVLSPRDIDGEGGVQALALTRQQHAHTALQATLSLVPSGRSKLFGVLRQHYPHRRLRAEALSDYALQALRVVQYAPLIEENVVRLIIEKSLEIDVEIKIMDTGEAVVDEDDEEGDALFTMDDLVDGAANSKEITDEVDEMAEKLDGVMLVLFTYLDQRLTAKSSVLAEAIVTSTLSDTNASTSEDVPVKDDNNGHIRQNITVAGAEEDVAAGGVRALPPNALRNRQLSASASDIGQDMEPVARLLQSLLVVFEENILPTYRSKFVQYILFFACGRAPGLCHALAGKLLDILRDDSRPKLIRQSSVAYLASFLARASYMEASTVSAALGVLLQWAQDYLDQHADSFAFAVPHTSGSKDFETPTTNRSRIRPQSWHGVNHSNSTPSVENSSVRKAGSVRASAVSGGGGRGSRGGAADHILFYSVCQATFYVMCFRGADIAAMDAVTDQAAIWERLLTCSLHPLRHCLDTVRREFARLCCTIMEAHLAPELVLHLETIARELPQVTQTITAGSSVSASTPRSSSPWTPARVTKAGGLGRGSNPLDSFFPFDPYLLRRSHVYVACMYNTWKSQDDKTIATKRRRARNPRTSSTAALSGSDSDSSQQNSDDDNDDDDISSVSSGGAGDVDDNVINSQSFAQSVSVTDRSGSGSTSGGLRARAHARRRAEVRRGMSGRRKSGDGDGSDDGDSDGGMGVSQKMADTYITESMSVTPASSIAVGSLMGRSLGNAMASSFADDGLAWRGRSVVEEDAFFHENVSPSASPPLPSSAVGSRSGTSEISSRRALF